MINNTCELFESGQIYFDEFVSRSYDEFCFLKESMDKEFDNINYESYVLTEVSFSGALQAIWKFIITAVEKIVEISKSFAKAVGRFIQDLIRKDSVEKYRGSFDMKFENDPFRNINETIIDYRNIDSIFKSDRMRYMDPLEVNVTTNPYQQILDAIDQHKISMAGSIDTYNDDSKFERELFGTAQLDSSYMPHERCVSFFKTIQSASAYADKNAFNFKQLCIHNINKFNNAVQNEQDPTLMKYFNDVKNGIAKVMDFNMQIQAKQMKFIKNALDQSNRIQSIWLRTA